MNEEIYHRMAGVEDRHWWFAGRRNIVAAFIKRLAPRRDAAILEAGCGTGGNLEMLGHFGQVHAMEYDQTALGYAQQRRAGDVAWGRLPDQIPFPGKKFDLILLLDVLEHLEDDAAALSALGSRLSDDGVLLVTVPAYRFLWSNHDVVHHHHRRYTKAQLQATVQSAGLYPQKLTYFNTLLFPVICLARVLAGKGEKTAALGLDIPPVLINSLLTVLFSAERSLLRNLTLPFGVSLLAVVRKPRENAG